MRRAEQLSQNLDSDEVEWCLGGEQIEVVLVVLQENAVFRTSNAILGGSVALKGHKWPVEE